MDARPGGATAGTTCIEVERKWHLRRPPGAPTLDAAASAVLTVDQVYLPKVAGRRLRLRRTVSAAGVAYETTAKLRLAPGVAVEDTVAVTAAEHDRLLLAADRRRRPVRKTRWVLPVPPALADLGVAEIVVDHITHPCDLWVAEAEYADTASAAACPDPLPGWLGPARDVTGEKGWTCASVARRGAPEAAAAR